MLKRGHSNSRDHQPPVLYQQLQANILQNLDHQLEAEHHFHCSLTKHGPGTPGRGIALDHAKQHQQAEMSKLASKAIEISKEAQHDMLLQELGQSKAYRRLEPSSVTPLHALYTVEGQFCTDPSMVDDIMQRHRASTFAGNVSGHLQTVIEYVVKYM